MVDLAVHPHRVGCLLSVGADQTVRLWDCRNPYGEPEKSCLVTFDTSAIVAVLIVAPPPYLLITDHSGHRKLTVLPYDRPSQPKGAVS